MTKTYDFETALSDLIRNRTDGWPGQLEVGCLILYKEEFNSRACEDFLRGAAQRIEILRIRQDGTIETEPFDGSSSQDSQNEKNAAVEIEATQVSVRLQKKPGNYQNQVLKLAN